MRNILKLQKKGYEMLVPAELYKYEIEKQMKLNSYTDEMLYYSGCVGGYNFELNDDNYGEHKYAIIDSNDKLIGFFAYNIDYYCRKAWNFGLYSFDKGKPVIGFDVFRQLNKLITEYKLHKITWRMIGGNPVGKHYDKFCFKNLGAKHYLKDEIKDKYGNYHDDIIYEIIFEN